MAQIPIPDNLLLRLRQTAQQDELSLARLFEKMLEVYLTTRQPNENASNGPAIVQNLDAADPIYAEITAFRELHPALLKKYPNQYVAIYQGKLVDHDANKIALLDRIEKTYSTDFVLVRSIYKEPEREFYFRSPRYIERI
ncbi:MAG: DUF5678 domain-containing protein [Caldilineaceae bacterium]